MDYRQILNQIQNLLLEYKTKSSSIDQTYSHLNKQRSEVEQLSRELSTGFPTLAKAYDEYFQLQDKQVEDLLIYKKHKAIESSNILRVALSARRQALSDNRVLRHQIETYETLVPSLDELKEENLSLRVSEEKYLLSENDESVQDNDNAELFLTEKQDKSLEPSIRYQKALDNYWKSNKSNLHIGILYERYVGSLFETDGYEVTYFGIIKGEEDLGRDLIAKMKNETSIIQCKNWSKSKTLHEKHIFQFFGTVFKYKMENINENVTAKFYTSTSVSDVARQFGQDLNIEIIENFSLPQPYPAIKCNVQMGSKEKIYHLPFDQQYDRVRIKPTLGETFVSTIAEAEKAGFRRAKRYSPKGNL